MADTIVDITLNCLLLPYDATLRSEVTVRSVTTLKISTGETVDQLRIMIRERWPCLFEKVPPAEFNLSKVVDNREGISINNRINDYSRGMYHNTIVTYPYDLVFKHFPEQPPNDKVHIIVEF